MKINPWLLAAALPLFYACDNDDDDDYDDDNDFQKGVFISNEGPFQGGNGTLSFYNTSTNEVSNDIFLDENERPLGNVVNSVHLFDDELYIVVNNSGVVEVVEAEDIESEGTITGLQQPRYAQGVATDVLAVTDWGANTVEFFNTESLAKMGTASTGAGPERMIINGNHLLVANSGGFGLDSTVTVLNIPTQTVIDTLFVGYNPNSFAVDVNGDIWVLCGGYTDWQNAANNKGASLYRIDASTYAVQDTFSFPVDKRPTALVNGIFGQNIYYLDNNYGGEPYEMAINATELPTSPLITGISGYGMAVDPIQNQLYITDPVDFASQGKVYRYNITTSTMVDTITVGIIPSNMAFN